MNRRTNDDFPTPVSPKSTTFTSRALVSRAAMWCSVQAPRLRVRLLFLEHGYFSEGRGAQVAVANLKINSAGGASMSGYLAQWNRAAVELGVVHTYPSAVMGDRF